MCMRKKWSRILQQSFLVVGITAAAFVVSVLIQTVVRNVGLVSMIYILAAFLCAVFTDGYIYGVAASLMDMLIVNWAFTYPQFAFNFTISDNLFSALCMLTVCIITSMLTTKLKRQKELETENEMERTRANLLRAVSHDLRTPLTSIYGSCSAVRENYDDLTREQKLQLMDQATEDAQWLIQMVENLLTVTRMHMDAHAQIQKAPILLEELVASVLSKFRAHHPDVNVSLEVPSDMVFIPMDAMLISQVLNNLLENAVQHAAGMTQICLRVRVRENDVVFAVEDDGCGLPSDAIRHLFSDFGRTKAQADGGKRGMGIGLSVCASIVKAHGGSITGENKPAGGCLFRFTLPLEENANEQ